MASAIYVLHLEPPLHHARHYIGIALDGDVDLRIAEHLAGSGSPLIRAAIAAGCRADLVLTAPSDRKLERKLHNRHGTRVCPRCRHQPRPRPRQLRLPITRQPASRRGGRRSLLRRCR